MKTSKDWYCTTSLSNPLQHCTAHPVKRLFFWCSMQAQQEILHAYTDMSVRSTGGIRHSWSSEVHIHLSPPQLCHVASVAAFTSHYSYMSCSKQATKNCTWKLMSAIQIEGCSLEHFLHLLMAELHYWKDLLQNLYNTDRTLFSDHSALNIMPYNWCREFPQSCDLKMLRNREYESTLAFALL